MVEGINENSLTKSINLSSCYISLLPGCLLFTKHKEYSNFSLYYGILPHPFLCPCKPMMHGMWMAQVAIKGSRRRAQSTAWEVRMGEKSRYMIWHRLAGSIKNKNKKAKAQEQKINSLLGNTAVNYIICTCRLGEEWIGTQDDESVQTARKKDWKIKFPNTFNSEEEFFSFPWHSLLSKILGSSNRKQACSCDGNIIWIIHLHSKAPAAFCSALVPRVTGVSSLGICHSFHQIAKLEPNTSYPTRPYLR